MNEIKDVNPYIIIEYDLLAAEAFVSKQTGKAVKLLPNDKLLYCYMRARIKYFVDQKKGEYFDTQESIADALSMNPSSAKASLAKFIENGILIGEKKKFKNFMNWRYEKLLALSFTNYKQKRQIQEFVEGHNEESYIDLIPY